MSYPLQSMFRIRAMREDRAASDLSRARRARTQAECVLREREDDRKAYESTKESRRDKVYESVMGRPVKMEALDMARDAVNRIDEEGVLLEEAEVKARHLLEERTHEAQKAHSAYVAAEKDKEKIVMHREVWEIENRYEQERLEDAEMEEFTGKRGSDDE